MLTYEMRLRQLCHDGKLKKLSFHAHIWDATGQAQISCFAVLSHFMLTYEMRQQKLCKLHSIAIQFFVAFAHTFAVKWRSRHLWSAIFGANLPAFLCTHIVRTQLVNTSLGSAWVLHQRINTSYSSYSRPWGDRTPQLLVSAVFNEFLKCVRW